jgi:hypothetical protein
MTIHSNNDAMPTPVAISLTNTADTAIGPTASKDIGVRFDSLIAACDGTATTFFLWVELPGPTKIYLVNGTQIAANGTLQVKDHGLPLAPGWALKCKAGAASHITVTAVLMQTTPKRQADAPQ